MTCDDAGDGDSDDGDDGNNDNNDDGIDCEWCEWCFEDPKTSFQSRRDPSYRHPLIDPTAL